MLEQYDERLKWCRISAIAFRKVKQSWQNAQIIPGRAEVACHDEAHPTSPQGRFGPNAWEGLIRNESTKFLRERVIEIVIGF